MNHPGSITPTEHEKTEWGRCARAMYARWEEAIGLKLSVAAARLGPGQCMSVGKFEELSAIYRAWLVFDEPKPAVAAVEEAQ